MYYYKLAQQTFRFTSILQHRVGAEIEDLYKFSVKRSIEERISV